MDSGVVVITSGRERPTVKDSKGATLSVECPPCSVVKGGHDVVIIANQGISGMPGTPGADAPGATVDYPAGENLSAGRVVIIDGGEAFYFQPSDPTHAGRAYGLTTTSATTGNDVTLQLLGEATDAAFSFSPNSTLWVGADGEIFDTVQAGVSHQKAGISSSANKLKLDFSVQIVQM